MKRIASAFYAIIAISVGMLILIGYFVPAVTPFQQILLEWAVILSGIALLVGIGNLFSVHLARVRARKKGHIYSLVTLVSLLGVLVLGVAGVSTATTFAMNAIIIPVEISLMATLTVTLIYASIRLLRQRTDYRSIIFLVTTLLVLSGIISVPSLLMGDSNLLAAISKSITQVLAVGGARGILIGIALGTITTGLRILLGADRPYGGN